MKHFLNPIKPETPPASPRSHKLEPLPNFSRSVAPVGVMAEKLDDLIEDITHRNHTSLEHMRSVESRVERVEKSVDGIKVEIVDLASDIKQIKEMLYVSLKAKDSTGSTPGNEIEAC